MDFTFSPGDVLKEIDFASPVQARYMRIVILETSAGGINEPLVINQ